MDKAISGNYYTLISAIRIKYIHGDKFSGFYAVFEQVTKITSIDIVFDQFPNIDTQPTSLSTDFVRNLGN